MAARPCARRTQPSPSISAPPSVLAPIDMASPSESTQAEAEDDDFSRRRRARALLDATVPGRSMAVSRCKLALETFRRDGDLPQARALLRDALDCSNVHHPSIYRAWISMEEQAGTSAPAIRELFEAWRGWYYYQYHHQLEKKKKDDDEGGFWCRYIGFEIRRGSDATVRSVGERAVAACRGDPAVHARYAKAEMRLGCPARARAVLVSALDEFGADDAEARRFLSARWRRAAGNLGAMGGGGGFVASCRSAAHAGGLGRGRPTGGYSPSRDRALAKP